MAATPSSDVQSLLQLVRSHQRSHDDGTYDATSVTRCRTMLNKLKKVLPKLLRLISTAPAHQAVDLLHDMCELMELVIHARVCPHAPAVFVDEAKSASSENSAAADEGSVTQSFPTIATILLYLVSFYCNEQLAQAQEMVLKIVVQLTVLLQSRDVYASLHFFRDTVELLEDCLLLEECMRRTEAGDKENGAASIACYLNTAIHAFHGSDGPLAANSCLILCGCVAVEDTGAAEKRKLQLKGLLPSIYVSCYGSTIVLRTSITKLARELLYVAGSQITLDQASRRLCLLVEPLLERDAELVSKFAMGVSVVGEVSLRDKFELSVGTCELILELLRVFEPSERSIIQLAQAFFKWTSCYCNIADIVSAAEHVIVQITLMVPTMSLHGRDELWPVIMRWHEERLRSSTDKMATLINSSLKLFESMMGHACESAMLAALQLIQASEVASLDEASQAIFVKITHKFLSARRTLALFLKSCSRNLSKLQHQNLQGPRTTARKRKRTNEHVVRFQTSTPNDNDQIADVMANTMVELIFSHESDTSQEVRQMMLALRVLLPVRPLADRIGRVETQTIIRAIIQRVEELLRSGDMTTSGSDLTVILLIYLTEQEVGRFRSAVESMLSSIGDDKALVRDFDCNEGYPSLLFNLANNSNIHREIPVEWVADGVAEWFRKCDHFVNGVIQLPQPLRRLFLLIVVWKHYRAFGFRIADWSDCLSGRLVRRIITNPTSSPIKVTMVSMLPFILAFVDKEQAGLEPYNRLLASIIALLSEVCTTSKNTDPTLAVACLQGIQYAICVSASSAFVDDEFMKWSSRRTSCCPRALSKPEHSMALSGSRSNVFDPVLAVFRDADMIKTFRVACLDILSSVLRHVDIVLAQVEPILDVLYSSIADPDRATRRIALRHLRMCVDLPACAPFFLDSGIASTSVMERLNVGIARAFKDQDFLLLESCIEAIGAICTSTAVVAADYRDVLVWGLLQLLVLWINTHNTQVPVSTAVHDQMRRILLCHSTSWKLLLKTYPEELYYPVVNNLLRTRSLLAFTCTYFGAHFDETILLRDSAAYVLPYYIVNRQHDMMENFIEAFNGVRGEDDVDMDDVMSEHYPPSTKTMSALLLDNIEYVLKELIIHQMEAANNENRIKEWEFLFRYLPENSTIRDVISHSPLRLLNLLAWELGGERSSLAKKAFREISQYLSQGKDVPEGDVDSALVMPRQYFLGLMTDLGYRISKRGPNTSIMHRTRAIRSIHRLFGMFNHRVGSDDETARGALDPFVPKVMAILKVGLYEKQLQESAILAWSAFVRMLTPKALESNFVSIVVSVLPCIPGSSNPLSGAINRDEEQLWSLDQIEETPLTNAYAGNGSSPTGTSIGAAVDLLKYLFVEKRSDISQAFPRVRLFPSVPALDEVYATFVAEVGDPSRRSLVEFLQQCLPYVTHWDSGVRDIVLRELHHSLVTRATELRQLVQAEGDFVDPAVSDILFGVLNVAKTDPLEGIRLLCAKVLGALGAVDGARIPLNVLHTSNSGASTVKDRGDPRVEYSTKDLACVLIENWLVKELRAAPENTDSVAFSIQELLKFLADMSADPQHSGQSLDGGVRRAKSHNISPMPEWIKRRFERKDVLEFVEPYWYTNYSISNKRKPRTDTSTSFYEKYSSSYEEWLHSWCRRLIDLSQPPERKIFQACEMVLNTSSQVGRFVLPYLLQNVLRSGRPEIYEEVKREVMAVLKDDGVMDDVTKSVSIELASSRRWRKDDANERAFNEYASRHHQCAQTIVSTIDELNEWVWSNEKKRLALSATASRSNAPSHARSGDVPSELDDQEKENLEEFLKDIPSQALSNAAFKIKAYARALQYFEVYLRQQQPPPKNESGNTSTLLTTLPVDLALVSKHSAYLQQLYSRVDEPDALTGLATLRRLYDAQRNADPSSERAVDDQHQSLVYLLHQVVDHEQLAQWEDALACYEQAIQEVHSAEAGRDYYSDVPHDEDDISDDNVVALGVIRDPRAVKPALYSGIVQCLIQLGRLESALQHINGIVTQEPQFVGTLYPHALECAWRLSRWDLVSELLNTEQQSSLLSNSLVQGDVSSRLRNLDVSQLSLVRVLHSFHEGNLKSFCRSLGEARSEIMGPLAAACAESYQRAYPLLHKLHFLHEAEQGFISLHSSRDMDIVAREKRWNQQCPWDARYDLLSASLKFRDPILALRRVMLQEADLKSEVSQNWLSYAKIARKEGYIRTANSAVMHAEALDNPYASLEKAKLMVAQDRMYEALQILEPVDIEASKIEFKVEDPHYCAKNLLLATNWMQESGQRQGKKVVERYEAVIKFDPKWEKGYFFLAKYYEYLLSVSHPEAPTATNSTPITRNDEAPVNIDSIFHSHLINLMKNYVLALSHGTKHVFQSMPRLLTLWFEYGELLQAGSNKGASVNKAMRSIEIELSQSNTEQQILTDIAQIMHNATEMLPAYEWLVCFPQVTSRICHPNPIVVDGVKRILLRVLMTYPTQAMWPLLGLSRSLNSQRRNRARDIITATQRQFVSNDQQEVANSFGEGMRLAEELISLAGHDPANQRKIHIKLSRIRTKILVPVQAGLNTVLPLSGLAPSDDRHAAFMPHSQVHIKAFSDKADVMMTKEKPKRIEVLGTDGQLYPFLCKREKTGDLRKDARMMEFNTMINKLLQKDREGRKRKLRLRTYAVVCLNEESGLMEWVRHTKAMRQLIGQIHKTERGLIQPVRLTHEIKERFLGMQKKFANNITMMALFFRHKILGLPVFTPRFHQWFTNNFADPTAWFEARLAFSRSAAVWSMVGHIIGLGDRHGENILIDTTNGECVHVDFDCLFDKGLKLAKPEIVPFRLTPNIIDAFGITGYEGVFRRVCEVTMELLRGNKETLRSVLESFIHDPLVEWGRRGKNAQGMSTSANGRSIADIPSDRSKEETRIILKTIDDRLRGIYNLGDAIRPLVSSAHRSLLPENETLPLSVQGQVDKLIHEATSHENLAQMYIGWMPFL